MRLTPTTGLRAAIGGCVAALLVVLATPAPALASQITVTGSAVTVGEQPGSSSVTVVSNDPRPARNVKISVAATGDAANYVDVKVSGGTCKGSGSSVNCGKLGFGETKDFTVAVSLKSGSGLKNGEQKTGSLEFKVEGPNAGGGSAAMTVTGFEQVATAITGMVADINGKAIEGAKFSAGEFGSATTGADGKFSIEAQVEPETVIKWKVTKKGFKTLSDEYPVAAGAAIDIQPRLTKKGEEKSAAPTDDGGQAKPKNTDSGFTFTTWVLIILGVLLAIGGVFAIWMLLRKGKDDDDDEEPKLPDEPLTHQLSASQTGKFGVYEGSGTRPGADNPTMLHNGPLYRDDAPAGYGAAEPASAAGFGPAYSDAGSTRSMAAGPDAASTQRYPSAEPASGSWGGPDAAASTQRYPSAEPASGSWQSNQPTSDAGRYGSAEPASGSWGSNEPASGSWRSNEPASGSWQSNQPSSGSGHYGSEPASGSWGSGQSGSTQRYPAADPGAGRQPAGDGYGSGYDDRGAGSQQQYPQGGYGDAQQGGYGEPQPPRQSPGRHYRDDDYGDYDDRPRSW